MGSKPPRSYLPADYSQVAQTDPQSHLASGLAEAFRSSETPPFGQMLGTLFATQMANDARNLNTLLSALWAKHASVRRLEQPGRIAAGWK